MECPYCGVTNPPNRKTCIRCKYKFESITSEMDINKTMPDSKYFVKKEEEELNKDITNTMHKDSSINMKKENNNNFNRTLIECPVCKYPNIQGSTICQNCKTRLDIENVNATSPDIQADKNESPMKTKNPYTISKEDEEHSFSLHSVKRENEENSFTVKFKGNEVIVNRENLEEKNKFISAEAQSLLEYKDGDWFISNLSREQTTFIRIDAPFKLQKGDIILLGDRMFEFDS